MKSHLYFCLLAASCVALVSCKKYLDKLPNAKLAVPTTLSDLQALLDSYTLTKKYASSFSIMEDSYYVSSANYRSVTNSTFRNLYAWLSDPDDLADWTGVYTSVAVVCNTVLDYASRLDAGATEANALNDVKGRAHFLRGFYYFSISQLFTPPYDKSKEQSGLGLPLKLTNDINEPLYRSSVKETYAQILLDLQTASQLLPERQALKTRPDKASAYGALARVYLTLDQADSAYFYADRCIKLYGGDHLIDFNSLALSASAPFVRFNNEVIFHCVGPTASIIANSMAKIDSNLYASYSDDDLRKQAYFKSNNNGTYQYKGDYDGKGTQTGYTFGGITLDEMYLIRAEAGARTGNIAQALQDLNRLLLSRWRKDTFHPYATQDAQEFLSLIIGERRKELIFRGTRWLDLRRLRNDPALSVTPERLIDGKRYQLTPESEGYTLKIPAYIVGFGHISQNP
ncbi:SusD family protein [bacterium A37T11]|nr:SusD family protein [bacterium A37T11]